MGAEASAPQCAWPGCTNLAPKSGLTGLPFQCCGAHPEPGTTAWARDHAAALARNRPALASAEVPAPQPAPAEADASAGQPGALAHGGAKADSGKLGTHLLPTRPLEAIARVLDFGARKYAPDNWRKGIAYTRVYGAILRHMWAWWRGEQADPETREHPLAHAACEILFLLEYELGPAPRREAFDDRPEKG